MRAAVDDDDFYEDDEPVDRVVAAFEAGEKRTTTWPVLASPQPYTTTTATTNTANVVYR
jgi:hypothetical protein